MNDSAPAATPQRLGLLSGVGLLLTTAAIAARILVPENVPDSLVAPVLLDGLAWLAIGINGVAAWTDRTVRVRKHSWFPWAAVAIWVICIGLSMGAVTYLQDARNALGHLTVTIALALSLAFHVPGPALQRMLPPLLTGSVLALTLYSLWTLGITYPELREQIESNPDSIAALGHDPALLLERLDETGPPFRTANVLAGFLAMLFPLLSGIVISGTRQRQFLGAAVAGLAALGAIVQIAWSGSTGAWIALAVGVIGAAVWWFTPSTRRRWIAAGIVIAGIAGWTLTVAAPSAVKNVVPGSASMEVRAEYWSTAGKILNEHTWMGVGLDQYGYHFTEHRPTGLEETVRAHNVFVDYAVEIGVIGSLAFLALVLWILLRPAWVTEPMEAVPSHMPEYLIPGGILLALLAVSIGDAAWQLGDSPAWIGITALMAAVLWLAGAWAVHEIHIERPEAILGGALLAAVVHASVDVDWHSSGFAWTAVALAALLIHISTRFQEEGNGLRPRPTAFILPILAIVALSLPIRSAVQHRIALAQLRENPFDAARFTAVVTATPEDLSPWLMRADAGLGMLAADASALDAEGRQAVYLGTVHDLNECIQLNPRAVNLFLRQARAGELMLRLIPADDARREEIQTAAENALLDAHKLDPNRPEIPLRLGMLLSTQGEELADRSASLVKESLELDDSAPRGLRLSEAQRQQAERFLKED